MPEIDPNDHDISELGPKIQEVEDLDELEAMLEAEKAGQDRVGAKKLIESRIEKFAEDEDEADGDLDPSEMSPADLGNELPKIDDVDALEDLLEREESGEDRDSVTRLIRNRIDSVQGSDEDTGETVVQSPEEKYPELDHPTADKQYVEDLEGGSYEDMWVFCETQDGDLLDVSREMLGKARELMDDYNEQYGSEERVVAVLLGDGIDDLTDDAIAYGADVVVYQEDAELERFRHKSYTELFTRIARAGGELDEETEAGDSSWRDYDEPRYVLFPATNNGRDLSAQVQGELDSGLASDCSGLYIENTVISNPAKTGGEGDRQFERVLHMKRPDFSGFEYSTILCLDNPTREFHPQGASVIPGSFDAPDFDPEREGEVYEYDVDLDEDWFRVDVTEHDRLDDGVDLTGHNVIVALGRGIGDDPTEGMELGLDLVDAFEDADLGISRGIVTSSYDFDGHVEQYASEERQIGETGQVVAPKLYIAAGISGAIQHKVGMDESETIVSVNTDPGADIREFSDFFVEGDLFDVLPALTDALESGELDVAELQARGASDD
ncbi:electron transfer flavoprotein subunit alpha/FixB family protein [Halobacterium zhouii]|uniref:electron transfer flavoprotein subunit alpha/FixB family protein n=1 Tax=Halobacterium zhouii TaxID=2902624 RepID=UPI001E5881A1|nr:electron transfer flavoprotein subunit alpha/FixB family protein [Halobacterium zhouii]